MNDYEDMSKNNFSRGDFVQCNYRARWKGIIISVEKMKDFDNKIHTVCEVLMLKDRCGRETTKGNVMRRGSGWLTEVEPFTVSKKQLNWLPPTTRSVLIKKGLVNEN